MEYAGNFPIRYLRHCDGDIRLEEDDQSDQFRMDSTWIIRTGLREAGDAEEAESVSFEPLNSPGHFLRHKDGLCREDPFEDSPLYRSDASWRLRPYAQKLYSMIESTNYTMEYILAYDPRDALFGTRRVVWKGPPDAFFQEAIQPCTNSWSIEPVAPFVVPPHGGEGRIAEEFYFSIFEPETKFMHLQGTTGQDPRARKQCHISHWLWTVQERFEALPRRETIADLCPQCNLDMDYQPAVVAAHVRFNDKPGWSAPLVPTP
jgi:hypothetical protein